MANPRGDRGGGALEGLMHGLKLLEERGGVKGEWRKEVREKDQPPQAVGRLFASKADSAKGIAQTLGKIWFPSQGIKCKELGNNLFLFKFL